MLDSRLIEEVKESLRAMTDEEFDELMADLQRDGIIDENWRVLKRAPEPPRKTAANGKKPSRKRSPRRPSAS